MLQDAAQALAVSLMRRDALVSASFVELGDVLR